jgi:hypothetical protein
MRFRKVLVAAAVGAALTVGSLTTTATAQSSSAASTTATAQSSSASAEWHYTGESFGSRRLCEARGKVYQADWNWPYQCRGPHTDGLFYLYVYF